MREEETTTLFPVEDVLNELVQASMGWGIDEFAKVFYGLGPDEDVAYMNEKWGYVQRNGIIFGYAHLDGKNSKRVCQWIADQINGQ